MEKNVQPLLFELNVVERYGSSLRVKNGGADRNFEDHIDLDASAFSKLREIVDVLGESSARVQGLKNPITCLQSFLSASPDTEQRLYIVTLNRGETNERSFRRAVGFLKVGWKHLLLLDEVQRTHEMTVLCALDFFVQQKHRRLGYGKKLFDCMLLHENIQPWEIPVDNPSLSFRHFLRKHYNLAAVIPQLNRFVVFSGFSFPTSGTSQDGSRRSSNDSAADITAPVTCPLNFYQEAYQREDSITKSSSWRVLGLDGPSQGSNDLSL